MDSNPAHGRQQNKKILIVTADDFGLSEWVNEAVETGHRHGVLTNTSLMVTAPAVEDAVRRAKKLPNLGVGLHLVLMDGRPALQPEQLPDLTDDKGRFLIEPVKIGVRLFFEKKVKQQVEAEIRAQIELFLDTGLPLSHVDGHHHFHQHPTVIGLLAEMAPEYGIRTVRLPQEHWRYSWHAQRDKLVQRLFAWLLSVPRFTGMRQRLSRKGIRTNDFIFGLHESGHMTPERVNRFVSNLPPGISELYCHPATSPWQGDDSLPDDYECVEEFRAISDPDLKHLLQEQGVRLTNFNTLNLS